MKPREKEMARSTSLNSVRLLRGLSYAKGLHEFAHQLDYEDRRTDGAPALSTPAEYRTWAQVMTREFEQLRAADATGATTVLDTYGATNPAEFFAVTTEAFFERPRALRARHPELYASLAGFYR